MTDFDTRAAVRAVIAETDLTDPGVIAAKVAEQIPTEALRGVVEALLRDYVRVTFHSYPSNGALKPPSAISAKVAAIRRDAPGWLLRRVYVGDSEYRMLADCSYDHLEYLARQRRTKAAQTLAAAGWYERAAKAVQEADVATLGQLPPDALERLGAVGDPE